MSEQHQEKAEVKTEGDESSVDSQDAEVIIERQMEILRRLNDELLRTTRTQAMIGAGVVTLISLIDARLFLPQTQSPLWPAGFTITFLSFIAWYNHLGAARLSYTDLQLGVHREVGENISKHPKESPSTRERVREFFSKAAIHLPVTLFTFAGGSLTVSQFEEEIDEDETSRLVAKDGAEGIRHNNWILQTRERYVNAVRGYLTWTFFVLLMGILLMVFY